jgi:outer membrane protein assembly factor BamD (BamD/ComL family)
MLERARGAMASGNPAQALAVLDTYTDRFPYPALLPEATVLRIEALTKAGDPSAARRAADAFLAANPASPYADRIRTILAASNH